MINYQEICNKLDIKLEYVNYGWTNGGASANDTIFLFPCSEEWIKEISFWHEIGHILLNKNSKRSMSLSTMSREGAAWELGLNAAFEHGREWDYYSKELEWARKQLASYINGEYDDLKKHYRS